MTKNQAWSNTKVSVTKNFKYIKQIGDCCWCAIQSVSRMAQAVSQHMKKKKVQYTTTLCSKTRDSTCVSSYVLQTKYKNFKKKIQNQNFSIFNVEIIIRKKN